MVNPFRFWEEDPHGWTRHLFVGLVMGLIASRFNLGKIYLWLCVFIAIGKEFTDEFIEIADIIITMIGIFYHKLIKR